MKFINSDATSIHGSLKVGSVYTSESGEWKLGGFEVLSSVKDDESVIYVGTIYATARDINANYYNRPMEAWSLIQQDTHPLSWHRGGGISSKRTPIQRWTRLVLES